MNSHRSTCARQQRGGHKTRQGGCVGVCTVACAKLRASSGNQPAAQQVRPPVPASGKTTRHVTFDNCPAPHPPLHRHSKRTCQPCAFPGSVVFGQVRGNESAIGIHTFGRGSTPWLALANCAICESPNWAVAHHARPHGHAMHTSRIVTTHPHVQRCTRVGLRRELKCNGGRRAAKEAQIAH